MKKKKYKVRINCTSFEDIVVEATSKDKAIDRAYILFQCPQEGGEFAEFLEVEKDDKEVWE